MQVIWLLAQGHTVGATSKVTAFGARWIELLLARYNASGPDALANGRRRNGLNPSLRPRRCWTRCDCGWPSCRPTVGCG